MDSRDRACAALAETQFGAFGKEQALEREMTESAIRRRLATGRWSTILPAVYRMTGAPETWRMRSMAALLWSGAGSALAYRAAGAYWGLDGARPGWVELYVPQRCVAPAKWLILHRNSSLPPDEVTRMGPLDVTSPARSVLDLGAVIAPRDVEHALEDAIRRKLTDVLELNRILNRHAASGRNGAGVLRALLETRLPNDAVLRTRFERRVLSLIKEAGLPAPAKSHLVVDSDGYPFAEIDLAYPDLMLGIECDSYGFHSGREAWEQNLARRNRLTLLGWYIIHVTWRQLTTRPDRVIDEIQRGIALCTERLARRGFVRD